MSGGWLQDFAFAARMLRRDWRAGELTVLIAALLIAVSAMTGVAFLTDRVGQAVELRAAESLAAAEEALGLIEVEYEELPAVTDMDEARTNTDGWGAARLAAEFGLGIVGGDTARAAAPRARAARARATAATATPGPTATPNNSPRAKPLT